MRILTVDELSKILGNLNERAIPAISDAMQLAALNVEGKAKDNCTPGKSPYYKAPYSDDNDPRREPPHMRDTITGETKIEDNTVRGIVGTPKHYAIYVHEGTSKMQARPFILDAINEKDAQTREILSKAIYDQVRAECE